jgi:hypothetical protein
MTVRHRSALLLAMMFTLVCVGVVPGCGSGAQEIPLAKVPPPPEGFGQAKTKSKIPTTASPTNANERRR